MKLKTGLVLVALSSVVTITGCSSIMGEKVSRDVPFAGAGQTQFTFSKKGEFTKSDVIRALRDGMVDASSYGKVRGFHEEGAQGTTYRGVRTSWDKKSNQIRATIQSNYKSLVDERQASYGVSIKETDNQFIATVTCPSSYHDEQTLSGGIIGTMQGGDVFPKDRLVADFNRMCSESKPVMKKSKLIKGEFNSKYRSEDVFANFSRILNKDTHRVHGFDIEKAENFHFKSDNLNPTTLGLSVYPYRGGSKIVYGFHYAYKNTSDGKTSYSEKAIDLAKNKIKAIAND